MRHRAAWSSIILLVALYLGVPFASAQTLHQAFNHNSLDGTNDVGVRYYASTYGVNPGELPWGSLATDGKSLLLIDKSWFNSFAPPPGGGANAFDAEARFAFVGSGIDLLHIRDNAGEALEWEIVDGGSGDVYNVVASGMIDTYTPGAPFLETVHLAPQGALSTNKIHMLRTRIKDTDGLGGGGVWKRRAFIDAYAVYDEMPLPFDDNSNLSGNWTFSANWDEDLPENQAYEGGRAASPGPGETIDFNFTGTSLVVNGFAQRGINGVYNWAIDGGAGGSGTVDQTLDNDFALRWPEILVNGLSSGPHTLKITVEGSGTAGRFQPNLGFSQIDSIRVFDAGPIAGVNGDYNSNGVVDAADYIVWRNSLGMNVALPNENPTAGTPGVVDQEDYNFWKSRFGATAGSGVGALAGVPEPASVALVFGAVVCLVSLTRRRIDK